MTVSPKYLINTSDDTGSIDLYVNNVVVTHYDYQNNMVTLSPLVVDTVISLEQLISNLHGTQIWAGMVQQYLSPNTTTLSPFLQKQIKDTKLHADMQINNAQITLAVFKPNPRTFTFTARPQIQLSWSDFMLWVQFLNSFLTNAISF